MVALAQRGNRAVLEPKLKPAPTQQLLVTVISIKQQTTDRRRQPVRFTAMSRVNPERPPLHRKSRHEKVRTSTIIHWIHATPEYSARPATRSKCSTTALHSSTRECSHAALQCSSFRRFRYQRRTFPDGRALSGSMPRARSCSRILSAAAKSFARLALTHASSSRSVSASTAGPAEAPLAPYDPPP